RRVLECDRPAQLARRRAGNDRQRDLGADALNGEQEHEQVPLFRRAEAEQLQRVLADVQVCLDRQLLPALAQHRGGRLDELADAVDVEYETGRRQARALPSQPSDHRANSARRGAVAWQIATASASAAWFGVGSFGNDRIAFTIFCTCALSARP